MIRFSSSQLDLLAHYCMDVAKGLTLTALAIPLITSVVTVFISLKIFATAMLFIYVSLILLKSKEVSTP